MIGTSLPEYIFIRISIFVLQYTTPLCLLYLLILVAVEGVEGALYWSSKLAIGQLSIHLCYLTPRGGRFFIRCLDNIPDVPGYLRTWFLGADKSGIRRDNVREFISWAFFDRHLGNETALEREELDEYLIEIENRLGYQLQPGRGKAQSLRLTLDEIEVRYRSVVWYFIVGLVDFVTHLQLSRQGFQYYAQPKDHSHPVIPLRLQSLFTKKHSVSQLSYWYRPHTAKDKLPLVFLHGIGIGLWPYTRYLSNINEASTKDDQIGIIALEYLPVSARLTNAPLSQTLFLSQMTLLLETHGWDQFAVLGHSLGPRIQSVVLVDPVCILLHLPDVAYNFTRRKPRRANEYLLWYFASSDPGVAHCLGRHFFWKDNIAWKEDLIQIVENPLTSRGTNRATQPKKLRLRKVAVCLAERDLIVNTPTVLRYLLNDENWISAGHVLDKATSVSTRHPIAKLQGDRFERNGIEVVWFDGLDHAQAFDGKETSARLAALTRRSCARSQL
ncbi:hypothetical protein ONZ43_g5050 [Nemania bipapillata]|uniref:Uncharacterized protein n=1 Tax=Nemania bipapillata TaxID=110536 RepID=A0ACC2IFG9_9PEZI|nr:hypothetical protein ONZ43_g5050 [Nemania bipapillata]